MSLLRRTCKEVTHLVLQSEDQRLPLIDRLAVRLHMMVCHACPRFVDQVVLMRRAGERWRRYSESGELPGGDRSGPSGPSTPSGPDTHTAQGD